MCVGRGPGDPEGGGNAKECRMERYQRREIPTDADLIIRILRVQSRIAYVQACRGNGAAPTMALEHFRRR